jgi:nucleoside-diphosphate kinase
MERTLILVKPDAVNRQLSGKIISRFEEKGLKLVALKMLHMDEALGRKHYAAHVEKAFFPELLQYMTSSPIVAAVLEGEGAVEKVRKIMGATNPAKADPGTIRKDFALDMTRNSIHGSDSPETAATEIKLFFKDSEIFRY